MSEKVRVRFAPSPTGFQHIGGLRTALYNYLFAQKEDGVFILRIEDTDQKRFVAGAVENTIAFLENFGMAPQEGPKFQKDFVNDLLSEKYPGIVHHGSFAPYIQSEGLASYQETALRLVQENKAYYCFCTAERLAILHDEQSKEKRAPKYDRLCKNLSALEIKERKEKGEAAVVRFAIPGNRSAIKARDLIHDEVIFQAETLDDFIILKSDGYPTYHLAHIVDDHRMEISHVLRAVEWLPSLPKHILLYEALGWPLPFIGHLPTILGSDGKKKLSKRDGDVSIEYFEKAGYLREALINFVALLGWNPGKGSTKEIFSLSELVQAFDFAQIHKAGAVFDLKKLDWMNAQYLKKLSIDELYEKAIAFDLLESEFFSTVPAIKKSEAFLKKILAVEQDRLVRLSDIGIHNPFFFASTLSYDASLLHWKDNDATMTKTALVQAEKLLSGLDETIWDDAELLETKLLEAAGDKKGDFLSPLRVALTGAERSPSPAQAVWVLGKEEALLRIKNAIEKLA
ncbi:MAG: glutamate--tRNA ligase [Candidatus Moranbacteria bacterium]|nr:glutamate--tRNA ligase [Candidatus Moranbacteria bacterium]